MKSDEFIVGVDVGGTKILSVVVNNEFEIVSRCRKKTKGWVKDTNPENKIIQTIEESVEQAGNPKIVGIGIGAPGPVDPKKWDCHKHSKSWLGKFSYCRYPLKTFCRSCCIG